MQTPLYDVRKGKKLSQRQLADRAGVQQGTISLLERGVSEPKLCVARRLARALETSIDVLFPDEMAEASG